MSQTPIPVRGMPTAETMGAMRALAEVISDSQFVPHGLRGQVSSILHVMLKADAMGLNWAHALESLYPVIKYSGDGKPSARLGIEGNAVVALWYANGFKFEILKDTPEEFQGRLTRPDGQVFEKGFTYQEAVDAGLTQTSKGPKATYNKTWRRDMLQWRTIARLAKIASPDLLHGLYLKEELEDMDQTEKHESQMAIVRSAPQPPTATEDGDAEPSTETQKELPGPPATINTGRVGRKRKADPIPVATTAAPVTTAVPETSGPQPGTPPEPDLKQRVTTILNEGFLAAGGKDGGMTSHMMHLFLRGRLDLPDKSASGSLEGDLPTKASDYLNINTDPPTGVAPDFLKAAKADPKRMREDPYSYGKEMRFGPQAKLILFARESNWPAEALVVAKRLASGFADETTFITWCQRFAPKDSEESIIAYLQASEVSKTAGPKLQQMSAKCGEPVAILLKAIESKVKKQIHEMVKDELDKAIDEYQKVVDSTTAEPAEPAKPESPKTAEEPSDADETVSMFDLK